MATRCIQLASYFDYDMKLCWDQKIFDLGNRKVGENPFRISQDGFMLGFHDYDHEDDEKAFRALRERIIQAYIEKLQSTKKHLDSIIDCEYNRDVTA
jgi:hypothetical protein